MKTSRLLTISLIIPAIVISWQYLQSQVTADFEAPDTVSTGQQISLVNLSQGGTTYYWSFCSGSIKETPAGTNIGDLNDNLDVPTYITLVKDGDHCFSFISNQGHEKHGYAFVTKNYHGNSFLNYPVASDDLGGFGMLGVNCEGIQVKEDNGTWFGFVNNDHSIMRLNFGNSLFNLPVATNIPISGLDFAHGLWIGKEENNWVGFIGCSNGNKIIRLDFGNSLGNIPVIHNFGNLGGLVESPSTLTVVLENNEWHMFTNGPGSTLARLDFGASLFNTPTGVNLGTLGGAYCEGGGLNFLQDCETTTGYFTKYMYAYPGADMIYRFDFEGGFTGALTLTPLGNIGDLDRAHTNSEIVREGDQYMCYITNRATATLTMLVWPVCSNPSVQNCTQFTPPPFSYDQPGTYPVRLTVDEGMQTETSACKFITVLDCQLPVPEFTFTSYHLQAIFTNTSSPAITWHWDFGDGTSSEEKDPVHYFPVQGTYNVCLTSTDSCGDSTLCMEVNIACIPPESNYLFYVSFPDVYFSDTSATTVFISRLWEFGDGNTSTEKNPVHTYNIAPAVYNACLTIHDSCGVSTFCQDIYYIQPKKPPFSTGTDPYNDRLVQFNDETLGSTKWHWEFGDGKSSDIRNPVHLYPAYKTYNVCLKTGTSLTDSIFCDSVNIVSLYSSTWLSNASLFPNPASGQFFIGLTKSVASASLEIYDLTGMCLKKITYSNILSGKPVAVDISGFSSGMYFVKFGFVDYEMTWKLIVR